MKLRSALAVGFASLALCAVQSAAHAATLNVEYDVSGTSHVTHTDNDITIAPTTLSISNDTSTNTFTGHMPIAPAQSHFYVAGFLPIDAKVNFIEAAPLTGVIGRGFANTTASYYLRLSDVKVGGLPMIVGSHCQTKDPVVITASTPAGSTFNITNGGHLTGSYTIGNFENCLLQAWLINLLVPGSDNSVSLDVANGRFVA
ncbi:hypothetical protein [Nocardioides sp.]|uniref:hypothetical protein n=1 Tax=Nocardioides sp. TaxID=35761 RepID=UPI002625AAB7|nr:hypothetical protein [Nocardioides sp.]